MVRYQGKFRNERPYIGSRVAEPETLFSEQYFPSHDAVKFVSEEIFRINMLVKSAEMRDAKLVSPIYVSNKPIFPKNKENLIIGLLTGLFLGVLLVVGKKALKTLRVADHNNHE